jgi:hypothetical protein
MRHRRKEEDELHIKNNIKLNDNNFFSLVVFGKAPHTASVKG